MRPHALIAFALLACGLPGPALALCDLSVQGVNFGVIDPTRNNFSSGRVTVTCDEGRSLRVLISMGANAQGPERHLSGPQGTLLLYFLFADAGFSSEWGDDMHFSGKAVTVEAGTPSEHTVYGLLVPAPQPPAPGTYQDILMVTLTF